MTDVALHTIEICAGVGMLGEGLRAGLRYMGIETRACCFVEREAYPASVLAARMEEGSLDPAPVWPDLLTFDAGRWAGAVDGIVAGFPCQDLSLAGRRAGLDGKRSGLFFNILDIADDCGAWFLFLENVSGIASATASVVDEAEGALEERAASRVLGELAERGWDAEWLTLSASDVGASHGRERWFCFAWKSMDNTAGPRCDGAWERATTNSESGECLLGEGCQNMDDAQRQQQPGQRVHAGSRDSGARAIDADGTGAAVAGPFFALGPADPAWRDILTSSPWLAPALSIEEQHDAQAAFAAAQSDVRGEPDGLAPRLDFDARAQRLKCCGNGVVALQAALAFVVLARRAGLKPNSPHQAGFILEGCQ